MSITMSVRGRDGSSWRYWLYFVESRYRTQRGFFPFSLDTSHPNDFEHVFLILAPRAGSFLDSDDPSMGLGIERIVANVHDGRVPNHVTPISAGTRVAERPLLLVELGSHSLAPDVDGDGYVRTNLDVEPRRITWGLRDTGRIWAWRSPDDASLRDASASTTLIPAGAPGAEGDRTYELEPMPSVDAAFRSLALAPAQEESAFRGQVNPFKRLFGKNDGGSPALRRPSSNADHGDAGRLLNDSVERQRGLSLGFTNTFDSYTLMLGARLPLATPGRPWPALTADVGVVFPLRWTRYSTPSSWPPTKSTRRLTCSGALPGWPTAAASVRPTGWSACNCSSVASDCVVHSGAVARSTTTRPTSVSSTDFWK